MKKGWVGIFLFLLIAFMAITLSKKAPEVSTSHLSSSTVQDSTRSEVMEFWNAYHEATNLRIAGQYRQAVNYYVSALRINPNHQNSLYYLGNMYLALGNYTNAERVWKRLIRINSSSARGYSQLGTLYSCRETGNNLYDLDKATDHFGKASRLNLEETGPLLQLAKINLTKNRLNQAEKQLNDVISSNFRSVEAIFLKGYLAWKKEDMQEADLLLKQSISIVAGTSEKANVGEGETQKGASPLTAEPSRCDILSRLIQQSVHTAIQTASAAGKIYPRFENEFRSQY